MTATAILTPVKFCKKCQTETERQACGKCKACAKACRGADPEKVKSQMLAWRLANKEKLIAYAAARHAAEPEKSKAASKAWRAANPDKVIAQHASWYANNAEHARAKSAAWRKANPEKAKAADAAWYAANTDKVKVRHAAWHEANADRSKANSAAYRAANPERISATQKEWFAANPNAKRVYEQNRRARKRESGGVLSRGLSAKLFFLQKGKCVCCGLPLGDGYHMDHIIALSQGGANSDDNVQLLRMRCNIQKKAKHPIDFMQERGFLL